MLDKHLIAEIRPQAQEKNIVLWKNYRVTVLQDRLFRLEYNANQKFRDDATLSVFYRDMPVQEFSVETTDKNCVISTPSCKLVLVDTRKDCYVEINGKRLKIDNTGNLKGTYRTLDGYDGDTFVGLSNDRKKDKTKEIEFL